MRAAPERLQATGRDRSSLVNSGKRAMGRFRVCGALAAARSSAVVALSSQLLLASCARAARSVAVVGPGPRSGHNLVFDRAGGRTLLLFGYSGTALPPRSEIWS